MKVLENQLLVIFGASGDLTSRKLIPALFEIFSQNLLPDGFAILGVARKEMTTEEFRSKISSELSMSGETKPGKNVIEAFVPMLHYISVNTMDTGEYRIIRTKIDELQQTHHTGGNCIFYMATPPSLYEIIASGLRINGLTTNDTGWKRIIVEKPFGMNLKSAQLLNNHLLQCFDEDQIYRIDHYLGKETVQNIMVTRFSNGIFEPLWNRNYIHHVEITAAESIGVEGRGGYYDKSGALRDMVQNHLLQLVSLTAMEPPTRIHAHDIRNETLKVLHSVRRIEKVNSDVIRGQYTESMVRGIRYNGYRSEPGVAPDSRTETYIALRLFIDNWRWGGVPFYIRTGKYMPVRVSEIVVHFRPTPHRLFCFDEGRLNSDNQLIIRIQPDEGILFKIGMKIPGTGFHVQDVNLDFHYSDLGSQNLPEAYQRLLVDAMQGDATLFTRGDAIEQSWKIVDPILKAWENDPAIPIFGYPAVTWGPQEVDSLIDDSTMTWRYPCKNLAEGIYCEL